MSWGGEEEQDAAIAEGNLDAKNWHDEARQIIKRKVCHAVVVKQETIPTTYKTDGCVL